MLLFPRSQVSVPTLTQSSCRYIPSAGHKLEAADPAREPVESHVDERAEIPIAVDVADTYSASQATT